MRVMANVAHWADSVTRLCGHERTRMVALTVYYLGILLALIAMYGRGNFATPHFIYQAF